MRKWLAISFVVLALGCGSGDNSLSGSISEVDSLAFQSVSIGLLGSSLIVEYLVGTTTTSGIAAKLTVDLTGLTAYQSIDLTTQLANGNSRGTLEQITTTTQEFSIIRGTLTLSGAPMANHALTGQFYTTLSGNEMRTLNGAFSGTVTPEQ